MNNSIFKWPSDKKLILYFTNWSIYARNYFVKDLPIDYATDINYAFYNIDPLRLEAVTGDSWADTEMVYTDAAKTVSGVAEKWGLDKDSYGCFNQFKQLYAKGKRFNLGLSIGGWTWSANFSKAVEPSKVDNFTNGIINFLKKNPMFNVVDFDWEYISKGGESFGLQGNATNVNDPQNFVKMLALLKSKLVLNGMEDYEITACVSADVKKLAHLDLQGMSNYLDSFNVMTYDFADGNWGMTKSSHQTNLYKTPDTMFSIDEAVQYLLNNGVVSTKIVIGAAYYSRGFSNCSGMFKSCSGGSSDMSWEKGCVDYKKLPLPGALEYYDSQACAGYSVDSSKNIVNSYDTIASVTEKANYILKNNLKGIICWEASGDKPPGDPRCLTAKMCEILKGGVAGNVENTTQTVPITKPKPQQTKKDSLPILPIMSDNMDVSDSNSIKPWNFPISYELNQSVSYNGKTYACITPHTSNVSWTPDITITLWKLLGDSIVIDDDKVFKVGKQKEKKSIIMPAVSPSSAILSSAVPILSDLVNKCDQVSTTNAVQYASQVVNSLVQLAQNPPSTVAINSTVDAKDINNETKTEEKVVKKRKTEVSETLATVGNYVNAHMNTIQQILILLQGLANPKN